MRWFRAIWTPAYRLEDRDVISLHRGNMIGATALFVALWLACPEWTRVPYAVFYGAAMFNSIVGILVRRDLRAWESSQASDAVPGTPRESSD